MFRKIMSSLTVRVSLLLLLALGSIVGTTVIFSWFLSHHSDVPQLLDDLGKQRMLSMQIVATGQELETDTDRRVQQLEEVGERFEQTLERLRSDTVNCRFITEEIDALIGQTLEVWKQTDSYIQLAGHSDATAQQQTQAREAIVANGHLLAELSHQIVQKLRHDVEQSGRNMWWVMVGAVGFNVVLVIVGFLLTRRHIVGPIQRLERAAQRLRQGDFSVRVEQSGGAEIGVLQQTFNETAGELDELVDRLEKEREFAEAVLIHAPAGVVVHGEDGVTFVNPELQAMAGVDDISDTEQLVEMFDPDDRDQARPTLSIDANEDASSPVQIRLNNGGSEPRPVEVESVPVEYAGRRAVMTVIRDLTERQQMTAKMMQMDRMIAIGTLVGGIGHEINNPLSFLMSNLEYSLRQLPDNEDEQPMEPADLQIVREALQEAHDGAERIGDIVARLRSFTHRDEASDQDVDLQKAIESAIQMARGEIRHRARLITDLDDVPPVKGNASRLARVVLNLLINAAQAIDDGNVDDDTITVRLFADDDQVILEVRDTGDGIDKDVAERIFDPFFTTKDPGEGTGLGLATCHNIVEAHDGSITFDSTPGKGTMFRVRLPAVSERTSSKRPRTRETGDAGQMTVAVVDDEPMVGKTFERTLRRDHDVEVFTDAESFLDRVDGGAQFDLIFCDLMMPRMTGMDLHERIEQDYPGLLSRLVFITGGAFTSGANRFLEDVDPPLLYKPFSMAELREFLQEFEG